MSHAILPEFAAAAALCALAAFALAFAQALMGARIGTDHPGHVFLIRALRHNRHRLFVRIPKLLNDAVVAALPLYLHWIFSWLGDRALYWAERVLNPAMSALHIVVFAGLLALAWGDAPHVFAGVLAGVACFAFTPQFYHALSARNFGLSSRSVGLVALTAAFFGAWRIAEGDASGWVIGGAGAFLVWGFSTFAAQALVILSLLAAALFQRLAPAGVALAGLALFVAVHPRYALGYVRHTLAFIAAYARELAPVYILARRFSVWRDLVWDIPQELRRGFVAGLRYAYENPVLVVAVLNPLALVAAWARLGGGMHGGLGGYAGELAVCGLAAMLLTSLRATRFLGEPERYVEAAAPWSALAAVVFAADTWGDAALCVVGAVFLGLAVLQLAAFRVLFRTLNARPLDLVGAEAAVTRFAGGDVRLASNNEHFTKLFMLNDWQFAYCIAVGRGYAGMTIGEAFSRFPLLTQPALERILARYRINVCVIDRATGDRPFAGAPPHALERSELIHESPAMRVFGLSWREAA